MYNDCGLEHSQSMPESFKAFCRMVSLTAAKTRRIFEVSVACVRLANVSIHSKPSSLLPKLTEDRDSSERDLLG